MPEQDQARLLSKNTNDIGYVRIDDREERYNERPDSSEFPFLFRDTLTKLLNSPKMKFRELMGEGLELFLISFLFYYYGKKEQVLSHKKLSQ